MKIKYDVYISLAMHGRLGKDVIDQGDNAETLCQRLGLTYYSPWRDEHIDSNRIIDKKPSKAVMRHYVEKDDKYLDKCKSLIMLTGNVSSSGTGWEMARMHYKNHRPIVVVSSKMADGALTNFTTIKADKVVATPMQGLRWLKCRLS